MDIVITDTGMDMVIRSAVSEAAGALQHASQILPEDKWGVVGEHRRELYPSMTDYAKQLRALEKVIREKPDAPALRFLLGWHYGFINYPRQAVKELDEAVELAPDDAVARRLRDMMQERVAPKPE